MSIRIQVPLPPDEHAALERLATAQRRSLGQQAAVMLAPLLSVAPKTVDPLPGWEPHPVYPGQWMRFDADGDLRADACRTANGWRWRTFLKEGPPVTGGIAAPDAETAMREADAALGETP